MTANDLVFSPRGPEENEFARHGLESSPQVRSARGGRLSFLILSPSSLSMPILVLGVLMAGSRRRPLPDWKLPRGPKRKLPKRARALRLAWALFLIVGVPLGFIAAPGPLLSAGIHIEPLRQFLQPWPFDIVKCIGRCIHCAGGTWCPCLSEVLACSGSVRGASRAGRRTVCPPLIQAVNAWISCSSSRAASTFNVSFT